MCMPFILVFHQSKCISAIKRTLFYYFHVYIFEFIHVFVCSLSLRCMLVPRALRVGVKTLCTINQITMVCFGFSDEVPTLKFEPVLGFAN